MAIDGARYSPKGRSLRIFTHLNIRVTFVGAKPTSVFGTRACQPVVRSSTTERR